ncbi:MAG TPA: hypothetical protein VD814_07155 [Nocardioides sp.]|nr:hypothetical protein [Nocardioides sp.]
MTAMTRGPLPARVYWRRRLVVLLAALALVVGTARVLTLGSDGSSGDEPQASQVAARSTASADPTTSATSEEPAAEEPQAKQRPAREARDRRSRDRDRGPVLAEPDGVCADRDIAVTPTVRTPVAGSPVTFTLELRTISTPACTWQASPSTLTMKLTSGQDEIWTSSDCPRAIPKQDLVVRNNVSTELEVTWSGRRSDEECSGLTEWAMPGWYFVNVAALAGEPSDLHFELTAPEPGVVTRTVRPEPRDRARKQNREDRDGRSRPAAGNRSDRSGQT